MREAQAAAAGMLVLGILAACCHSANEFARRGALGRDSQRTLPPPLVAAPQRTAQPLAPQPPAAPPPAPRRTRRTPPPPPAAPTVTRRTVAATPSPPPARPSSPAPARPSPPPRRRGRERVALSLCRASEQPLRLGDEALDRVCEQSSTIGGMAPSQYRLILKTLVEQKPTNMLVFSVGSDTPLWVKLNDGGYTTFVENSREWADKVRRSSPGAEITVVNYTNSFSRCKEDAALIAAGDASALRRNDLPHLRRRWGDRDFSVIFVDGPMGMTGSPLARHGRLQSATTALIVACGVVRRRGGTVTVFLHDCERPCEDHIARGVFAGRVAACQVWPRVELARDGRKAPSADVTLHRYDIRADHPTCNLASVQELVRRT
eukprot:TRINITY_DN3021_c0_g2_i1.p1 TRINITY_DN3021_c0_g2~~TRINITY_DN3021_c0_g2_i1.p1  ORF type:complete len:376 (+),score=117.46 TRINITY_DN3021_c0_g2_i1:49-1176(+)